MLNKEDNMPLIEILKDMIYNIKKEFYDFIFRKLESIPENAIIDLDRVYLKK